MASCPFCRVEVPQGSRFCPACGAALSTQAGKTERKFAAALFADIVGSTSLAEKHDPEVVADMIGRALALMADQVTRHGGTVVQMVGDGLLALFGTPRIHEDDCERAVRAAFEMHATISELNRQPRLEHRPNLEIHVGIEAGELLVQVGNDDSRTLTGDAVNTASRLQNAAGPGEIIVGPAVRSATGDAIEYRELDPLALKGKSDPVPAWIALRIRARGGAERPKVELKAPLIGRDEELSIMRQALARTESEGRPILMTILGAAGVGKSRLGWELLDHVEGLEQTFYWRTGRCLPYGGAPYGALAEAIRSHCEILEDDPIHVVTEKVRRAVEDLFGDDRLVPEIVALVGAGGREDFSREQLFDAWRRFLERMADRYPVVLMLEDLHWADEGLLDLVDHLADWATGSLFLLTMARPELLERRPTWGGGKRNYSALYLDPLSDSESETMLASLLGTRVPRSISSLIAERSEGNPLFTEELVRHFIDSGIVTRTREGWSAPTVDRDMKVPRSIQSLIAARIDSLSDEEKMLLQDAAVIGRGFWTGAIASLHPDASETTNVLDKLRLKELIVSREPSTLSGEQEFSFRHALIRDVAYESLPKSMRAAKHATVARWAEERTGERREDRAALIASHYSQALVLLTDLDDRTEERSRYARELYRWALSAAKQSAQLWQHKQAVRWYREAVALFDEVNASPEEQARILDAYATSTLGTETYEETASAHEAARRAYEQLGSFEDAGRIEARLAQIAFESSRDDLIPRVEAALERLEDLGDSEALASVLHVLGWYHWRRGRYAEAEPALRRAAEIAERVGADVVRGHALHSVGVLLVDRNDWRQGLELLEESYEIAQGAGSIDLRLRVAHNLPNVLAHFAPGELPAHGTTGIERARAVLEEGLQIARRAGNRRWESGILAMTAWVLKNAGDLAQAEDFATESLDSARAIGSSSLIGEHLLDVALIKIDRGDIEGAKVLYEEAADILKHHPEPGNEVWVALAGAPIKLAAGDRSGALALLVETLGSVGDNVSVYGGEWLVHHAVRALRDSGEIAEARTLLASKKPMLVGRPISEAALRWSEALLEDDPPVDDLRAVADTFDGFGWRVEHARCLLDLAKATKALGHDPKTVEKEALMILEECGAAHPPWIDPF